MIEQPTRELLELQLLPQNSSGVEIGVLRGTHARWMIENLHTSTVYLVDHWKSYFRDGVPRESRKREAQYAGILNRFAAEIVSGAVIVLRGSSSEVHTKIPDGSLNWVYVDGLHTYEGCLYDMETYRPKLLSGGHMLVHDYNAKTSPANGTKRAVAEYLHNHPKDIVVGNSMEYSGEIAIRCSL